MQRPEELRKQIEKVIEQGDRPSVELLAENLGWIKEDVHSCLNTLEKRGEVKTYVKEIWGRKIRLVALKR